MGLIYFLISLNIHKHSCNNTNILKGKNMTTQLLLIPFFLIASFYATFANANIDNNKIGKAPRTFPSLPTSYKKDRYKEIETAFEDRSRLFLQGWQFHSWTKNRPDNEIIEEFKSLNEWRNHTWYSESTGEALISRPDFMIAQDLLEKGYFKRPHLIAFDYNKTDNSYNSSTIVLNGQRFLALEAPTTDKLMQNFFNLLQNFQVTQLVRLTPANEKDVPKSLPYWTSRVSKGENANELILNAPFLGSRQTYPIRYYVIEQWLDNKGIDPKLLMSTLQAVRKNYDSNSGLLACHCSGGVGRTGTFLAGFLLMQEIDRQIAAGTPISSIDVSIEKIVLQLSLQRVHMVSRPAQYITLYRLVDLYIQELEKSSSTKQP